MSQYLQFLAFATVLVLIPGADFTVVARQAVASRRVRRTLDAATGGVLVAFSTRLALEHT